MTVLEVIQRSAEFLAKRGVDSPRLQVELLLAHALNMPRLNLYLNFARTLTDAELAVVRGLVKRRARREPLQHIVGTASFCGWELIVNPHVLVPRPETEALAERAWDFLSCLRASRPEGPLRALDLGTGSGCLAIALALKCPDTQIDAVDISAEALRVARENAARHGLVDRIQFFHGDTLSALPPGAHYDLIVSNPPYIATGELEGLQAEVRDFDPRIALDGGHDGLEFYRRLAAQAGEFLNAAGKMMLEFGNGQGERITCLLSENGWQDLAIERDFSGHDRILIASQA